MISGCAVNSRDVLYSEVLCSPSCPCFFIELYDLGVAHKKLSGNASERSDCEAGKEPLECLALVFIKRECGRAEFLSNIPVEVSNAWLFSEFAVKSIKRL